MVRFLRHRQPFHHLFQNQPHLLRLLQKQHPRLQRQLLRLRKQLLQLQRQHLALRQHQLLRERRSQIPPQLLQRKSREYWSARWL
ncbi:hypothetical protein AVDCRST_MAG94-6174 [uncultured Leptolyngbya sp.]|uniref:Uncharacterized protein n=1 Tax=uncultured Leptolyngbya sp. TaxID=332963 RepID=A0A6J4P580_9CYAN|nr:hypothetical protein AVDCRST_MAG94-6174 [uncultured Leptolyngbya sp.]